MQRLILAVICIAYAALSLAAVDKITQGPWYLVVTSSPQYPAATSLEDCIAKRDARIKRDAATKVSGTTTYYCRQGSAVKFKANPPPVTGSARLTITPAAESAPVDGYRILYGTSPTNLDRVVTTTSLTHVIEGLPAGTHYFAAVAFNSAGESGRTAIVSKTIE